MDYRMGKQKLTADSRTVGDSIIVDKVSDGDNWQEVKRTLLINVGMGLTPVIRIEDADYNQSRVLYLTHAYDGRDLDVEYAEKTLSYLYRLWGRPVKLDTRVDGRQTLLCYGEFGFDRGAPR